MMLTAQEHDQEDEKKRDSYSQSLFVSEPASRTIFAIAKARSAKIIFASNEEQ